MNEGENTRRKAGKLEDRRWQERRRSADSRGNSEGKFIHEERQSFVSSLISLPLSNLFRFFFFLKRTFVALLERFH